MNLKNTTQNFGMIAILLHWLMALIIIAMFILGKYMVDLDYYDTYYHIAPWWHKSFGLLIAFLWLFRLFWKLSNPKVKPLSTHTKKELLAAKTLQIVLYVLILVCCFSGVMISTAEGAGVSFFDLFEIPAFLANGESQAEFAEEVHEFATTGLIILAAVHMLAALKHHFIDKDKTLIRIFKPRA